ncbi:MAG: aminopeptidase P N-terminal domain-containing protein [Ignavibacterium sp.]|nr:MAG: aminopeptidase P N-terminal domain-containing protein [Ignavibacterium sp.]
MEKIKLLLVGILVLLVLSCTDQITTIVEESPLPVKLYPYETIYDEATFKARREALVNNIPNNTFALIFTNDIYLRNGSVDYDFRPSSCFFYLTGFDEPNAIAIVRKHIFGGTDQSELIMFVEERSGAWLQWLGPVYGPEGAMEYFYADTAYTIWEFKSVIKSIFDAQLYQSVYANLECNPSLVDSLYNCGGTVPTVHDINEIVDKQRVIKSSIELDLIQRAVDVTAQAFSQAIRNIEPGMYEYEVEAIFGYILKLNGCPRMAFPPIIASGPNINILHYSANSREMQNGDLVMMDYGAEYGYYAADITRTLPVNGKFTPQQATIYNIVLETIRTVINEAAPGKSYYDLYYRNRDIILDRLLEKGIISGNKNQIISSGQYRQYIPAGLAHPVGLDVHDPFPRESNGDKILKENMILAFEPHIYLYEGDQTVNQDYWNVSARIEDVVLITSTGAQVLSSSLPVEIADIEAMMK